MSDKNAIRAQMRALRKNFDKEARESADRAILDKFFSEFGKYESFFVYNSFSSEARTDLIIQKLLSENKRVYLPRVEGRDMLPVQYCGEQLKKGSYGIYEPQGEPFFNEIDVTLIPLLAVNSRGFRIGYGGGFYDRYLSVKNTMKVGMGYGFQLQEFEENSFDVPLNAFICESGIRFFNANF